MEKEKRYLPKNITNMCLIDAYKEMSSMLEKRLERFGKLIYEELVKRNAPVTDDQKNAHYVNECEYIKTVLEDDTIKIYLDKLTISNYYKLNILVPIKHFVEHTENEFIEHMDVKM